MPNKNMSCRLAKSLFWKETQSMKNHDMNVEVTSKLFN